MVSGAEVSLIFAALSFATFCSGRALTAISIPPATAVPYNPLFNKTTPGIASFLQGNANYSSFLALVQSDPTYSQLLKGDWAKGVTNNTVLVPTNAAVSLGFAQLGSSLNVPADPARYIEAASENNVGSAYTNTPLNAAIANVMAAILNSHILTEPINFFSDSKVLDSSPQKPVKLAISSILASSQAPQAFNNGTNPDEGALILVDQPAGLLTAPITVPKQYAQQLGNGKMLYLYVVDNLLVASQVGKGVTDGGSVATALQTIQTSLVGA